MENKEEVKQEELVYRKAPIWKRLVSSIVDAALTLLLAFTIFSLLNMACQGLPIINEQNEIRASLQLESGLYIEKEVPINEYVNGDSSPYSTYGEKKDFLGSRLTSFYANDKFATEEKRNDYDKRKIEASKDDVPLFSFGEDGYIIENSVNPSYLYDFYVDEIQNHALATLFETGEYAEATKNIFFAGVIEFVISFTISFPIFYLLPPLVFFKRGRQTLGKRLLNVSLIGPNALNLRVRSYLIRFFFVYFFYYLLGFFSFLLPEVISLFMLFFSKRSTDLADWALVQYAVDTTNATVYLDYEDYLEAKRMKEKAKLENKDLRLSH